MRDSYLWPTQGLSPSDLLSFFPLQKPFIHFFNISFSFFGIADDVRSHNCSSSSINSGPLIWPVGETNNQQEVKQRMGKRGWFIFDPIKISFVAFHSIIRYVDSFSVTCSHAGFPSSLPVHWWNF